jgi:ADP-heptose:LPS heptosyltransferase
VKRFLRTLMLTLVRIAGFPGARTARQRAQRGTISAPRILLLRPDHLGDLVLTTPVLQALREQIPNAQITLMVGPWSRDVVARHPALNRLLTCAFPGFQRAAQHPLEPYRLLFETASRLRREQYDLAVNLRPDFWWGAALLYLAGIPRRIGYDIAPGSPFLTQALPFPPVEHATVSNLRLASAASQVSGNNALAQPFTPERYPSYFRPTEEEQAWANERLHNRGGEIDRPIVVIHPGTGGEVKLWRAEGWARIANWLSSGGIGSEAPARIVLTGSPKEQPLLETIAHEMETKPLLVTDATVGQLSALLGRARLALGVDSGPLHLATAQDTLTLRLFGPTDTHIFGPWGVPSRHVIITSQQRCADCPAIPCGRLDFRPEELAQHPCVRLITEEQVCSEITKLLERCSFTQKVSGRFYENR